MNTTERAALLQSTVMVDEMHQLVDERTLNILERRRKTAVVRRRGWLVRRALLFADVVGLALAFFVAEMIYPPTGANADRVNMGTEYLLFLLTIPAWIVVAKIYRLYENDEERTDHSTVDDIVSVFHLVTVGTWLFFALTWVSGLADPLLAKLIIFWALAIGAISVSRGVARAWCRRRITYLQNTVIVGEGEVGQLIARKFLAHREYGINLVGFVDANPRERSGDLGHLSNLGSPDRLPGLVRVFDIERVVIAFSEESHEETLDLIRSVKDLDVQVDIVPRLFEMVGPNVGIHTVEGLPLVGLPPLHLSRSSTFIKRGFDVAFAAIGLVVLSPVFAVIAWRIKATSAGPMLFRQTRMGAEEKTFEILKFRTMTADAEERKHNLVHLNKHAGPGGDPRMFKIAADPRITPLGAFLRRYSLDELPQLWNVLKGDMSIVGPRPLILDEDQYVDAFGRRRVNLKPGITGPWQVMGASEIPFAEMVKLDYHYVMSWSLFNDVKLCLRTLPALLRVRSAY